MFLFKLYKSIILPLINQITGMPRSCRYYPSCSAYFEEAVRVYGVKGAGMGILRILRCNPLAKGGLDPVASAVEP